MNGDKIRILMLAANAEGLTPLALDREAREIETRLRGTPFSDRFEFVSAWAVRPSDLLENLNRHRPHIVHFSGHGKTGGIYLEDGEGAPVLVGAETLEEVFRVLRDNVRLVLLNACLSASQAEAISRHVDCAIGMGAEVGDDSAILFAAQFYRALAYGRSVRNAFEQGRLGIRLEGLRDHALPQLFTRRDVDPDVLTFADPEPAAADDPEETETTVNWLYTGLGLPLATVATLCLIKRSQPTKPVELPFIGDPGYGEYILVGSALVIPWMILLLLICRRYARLAHRTSSRWELLPPAFGRRLRGAVAPIRGLAFLLFVLWPWMVSVGLVKEVFGRGMLNTRQPDTVLRDWDMFRFPPDFYRGEDWRWNSRTKDNQPSFYPGIQPVFYTAGLLVAAGLVAQLAIRLAATGDRQATEKRFAQSPYSSPITPWSANPVFRGKSTQAPPPDTGDPTSAPDQPPAPPRSGNP